jgi:hypothetical protein
MLGLVLLCLSTSPSDLRAQLVVGQSNGALHLGVQSCGGQTCHGADKPWPNSSVLQNESLVWERQDLHSRAYRTLLTQQAQRMASNLGLVNATTAAQCLDCHADNAPMAERGPQFNVTDGVGCERCHGGAARWLGPHVSDTATHRGNIEAGLYPTAEPIARARLCISCHQRVDHRLYGAGHPRITFELDTYTANQPAHFRNDADYNLRKGTINGVKLWAIGQAVAATTMLDTISDFEGAAEGLLPELALFDCHSCHRSTAPPEEEAMQGPRVYRALPTVNDSGLIMLGIAAEVVAPDLAPAILAETMALRDAATGTRAGLASSARRLNELAQALLPRLAENPFTPNEQRLLLQAIWRRGHDGAFRDFADAEQAVMAVASIVAASRPQGSGDTTVEAAWRALDSLYEATRSQDAYRPSAFQQALGQLAPAPR